MANLRCLFVLKAIVVLYSLVKARPLLEGRLASSLPSLLAASPEEVFLNPMLLSGSSINSTWKMMFGRRVKAPNFQMIIVEISYLMATSNLATQISASLIASLINRLRLTSYLTYFSGRKLPIENIPWPYAFTASNKKWMK